MSTTEDQEKLDAGRRLLEWMGHDNPEAESDADLLWTLEDRSYTWNGTAWVEVREDVDEC